MVKIAQLIIIWGKLLLIWILYTAFMQYIISCLWAFASAMCIFIKPFYFPDINLWVTYIYSYVTFKWRSMAVIYLYLRPETCVNTINVTPWWRTRLAVLTRLLSLIVGLGGHLRVYWGQLIMLLGPSLQSFW